MGGERGGRLGPALREPRQPLPPGLLPALLRPRHPRRAQRARLRPRPDGQGRRGRHRHRLRQRPAHHRARRGGGGDAARLPAADARLLADRPRRRRPDRGRAAGVPRHRATRGTDRLPAPRRRLRPADGPLRRGRHAVAPGPQGLPLRRARDLATRRHDAPRVRPQRPHEAPRRRPPRALRPRRPARPARPDRDAHPVDRRLLRVRGRHLARRPHRQLHGARERRRGDVRQDAQGRDGDAEPAQDRDGLRDGPAPREEPHLRRPERGVAPRRPRPQPQGRRRARPLARAHLVQALRGVRLRRPDAQVRDRAPEDLRGQPRPVGSGPHRRHGGGGGGGTGQAAGRPHDPRLRAGRGLQHRPLQHPVLPLRALRGSAHPEGRQDARDDPHRHEAPDRRGPGGPRRGAGRRRRGGGEAVQGGLALVVGAGRGRPRRVGRRERPHAAAVRGGEGRKRRRRLGARDQVPGVGSLPAHRHRPEGRPPRREDRLHRLAGLGRPRAEGGRRRGEHPRLRGRQAGVRARGDRDAGDSHPAQGARPREPRVGLAGPAHRVDRGEGGGDAVHLHRHGGDGAQRLRARDASPAPRADRQRPADPSLRRRPGQGGEPADAAPAACSTSRRSWRRRRRPR